MGKISVIRQDEMPVVFEPQETAHRQAKIQALVAYAAKVRDWPLLQTAIKKKIEEQEEFVRWWAETVGKNHGGDRKSDDAKSKTQIAVFDKADAEALTGISQQQVSRWRKRLADPEKYEATEFESAYKKVMAAGREEGAPHVTSNSGNNEWYTPPEYIEAARIAMQGIDLDPASSEIANRTVKAAAFFSQADNGLEQPWRGRVWMNPPYSSDLIGKFCEKLLESYISGDVLQACVLVNNATETQWFQSLLSRAMAVCFPSGRIRYLSPDGEAGNSPLQGQSVLYLGGEKERFSEAFSGFGTILFGGSS